eukprot:363060-Chlamydomonas_euryale.AAC.5
MVLQPGHNPSHRELAMLQPKATCGGSRTCYASRSPVPPRSRIATAPPAQQSKEVADVPNTVWYGPACCQCAVYSTVSNDRSQA